MRYLVELVKEQTPDVPEKKIEYIITYLMKEGHISYTVEYHWDIYQFYIKSIEHYKSLGLKRKCAFIDTLDHFKISERTLYYIIKNFTAKVSAVETP
jgi:hypothetical protein